MLACYTRFVLVTIYGCRSRGSTKRGFSQAVSLLCAIFNIKSVIMRLPCLFFPVSFFHLICYINVMKLTSIKKIFIAIALPALFASCSSTPKEIPEDLTAQELIQKGQTEFENGRYKASLRYYNAVTERFAGEPAVYVEATYEIGHLFMKQKKYDKAEAVFQDLIDLYAAAQPGTLPGSYRKLSELEMEKIKAKKSN